MIIILIILAISILINVYLLWRVYDLKDTIEDLQSQRGRRTRDRIFGNKEDK